MRPRTFFITLLLSVMSVLSSSGTEPGDSISHSLQEIVVTGRHPHTRLKGSTLVTTVSGTPLEKLGTALDVLSQLPMIRIEDDEVEVIGRGTPSIYIDGRPMLSDDELKQLQSSDIKKIELDVMPGAMYASETSAVLRITTRRDFLTGLSLNNTVEVKRGRKWSFMEMLNASYRLGKFDIFFSGIYGDYCTVVKGHTVNTLQYGGIPVTVGSSQNKRHDSDVLPVKTGLCYSSGNRSMGLYYRYNPERGSMDNAGMEWYNSETPVSRVILNSTRAHSHTVSAYYDDVFTEDSRLHVDVVFKDSHSDNDMSTVYSDGGMHNVNSTDDRRSSIAGGKAYFEFPVCGGSLTIGTEDSYTRTSLDYRMLNESVSQYVPSALTRTRQVSASLFAGWKRSWNAFTLKAGARYEYVDFDFSRDGVRDEDVSGRTHMLTPDISMSYSFSDRLEASLSYKAVTERPPYSQLTGSLTYVGAHELEGGNPALRDGHVHHMMLTGMWGDWMFVVDGTRSLDTYAFVKQIYPADDLQLQLRPVNVDVTGLSCYMMWQRRIGIWMPAVTAGVYRQWLDVDGTAFDKPMFMYYFDNTLSLPHGIVVTANASGRSRGDMHTNRFGGTVFTLDASASKSFFDDSLSVKISANDIFNTANNDWSMSTYGVTMNKYQTYDRRNISLTLTYRIHPRKSSYKGEDALKGELERL